MCSGESQLLLDHLTIPAPTPEKNIFIFTQQIFYPPISALSADGVIFPSALLQR
jgi:hypothetical protein